MQRRSVVDGELTSAGALCAHSCGVNDAGVCSLCEWQHPCSTKHLPHVCDEHICYHLVRQASSGREREGRGAERACTHNHSTDASLWQSHLCTVADVLSLHCTLSPHAQGSSSVVPHHLYRYQLHCMLSRRQYVWHECRLTLSKHCLHHCACHHHHQAGFCSVNLTLLLVCRFRQMAAACIVLAVVMNVYAMNERSQFNTCFQV